MRVSYWLMSGAALAALACAPQAVLAQAVSSSIRGTVVAPDGTPVAGAAVEIVNTGTGAVTRATSGTGGAFTATGLPVGGPYTVTAVSDTYGRQTVEDVFLALGETSRITVAFEGAAATDETVVVLGARKSVDALDTRGVSTNFSAAEISNTPNIDRDFKSVINTSSFAFVNEADDTREVSVLGANPRCNSFLIDGLPQNDNFGLNRQGYPTARSPLPTDWAEQVQLSPTPYDVEYNDFCGGVINVVTKTGGNEFFGSAYYYEKRDNWTGRKVRDQAFTKNEFGEENYGFTFGGPIIKDTLFFFVGYDETQRTTPLEIGPAGSGAPLSVNGVTQADIDAVTNIARTVYGFDPLALTDEFVEENKRWIAKINWQITDDHRAQFTYQHAEGGTLSTRASNGTPPTLGLPSNWYLDAEELDSYSVQLFSNWTSRISTELRWGKVEVVGDQAPLGGTNFPEIYVRTPGNSYIAIGPDQFRHFNLLEYTFEIWKGTATFDLDDHVVKIGAERATREIFNGFVQGSRGIYRFDSIADFQSGIVATGNDTRLRAGRGREPVRYANAPTNNAADGAAAFEYDVDSLFIQDDWYVTDELSVQLGLRYTRYSTDSAVAENPRFVNDFGITNTKTLDGLDVWMPRASASYDATAIAEGWEIPANVTLRAGIGKFSGGQPNVWVSNSYSNTGVNYVEIAGDPNAPGPLSTVPDNFLATHGLNNLGTVPAVLQSLLTGLPTGGGLVNALDPNFKIPAQWRMNLGFDFEFGEESLLSGWRMSFDFLHFKGENQLWYYDIASTPIGTAPDGRLRYGTVAKTPGTASGAELILSNDDKGQGTYFIFSAEKVWDITDINADLSLKLSYTNSDVTEMNPLTSSTASSNFFNRSFVNFNEPEEHRSVYEREHRATVGLGFAKRFWGDFETRISLFGSRMSGQPFSYTFRNNPFGGNGPSGRATLYVPQTDASGNVTATSDPLVTYAGGFNVAQFNDFLQRSGLIEYAGGIAPVNGFEGSWSTRIDLSLEQEVPIAFGSRVVLELDILNLGNLLNKDWGRFATPGFPRTQGVVNGTIIGGQYQYSSLSTNDIHSTRYPASSWQLQLGARIEF